jgi:hypothetical protein
MNGPDDQLNRLLKSAARVQRPADEAPPFGLETRVIAEWRASARGEGADFLLAWFRRAAIGGGILALASVAWGFYGVGAPPGGSVGDELAFADSAMTTALNHD